MIRITATTLGHPTEHRTACEVLDSKLYLVGTVRLCECVIGYVGEYVGEYVSGYAKGMVENCVWFENGYG